MTGLSSACDQKCGQMGGWVLVTGWDLSS